MSESANRRRRREVNRRVDGCFTLLNALTDAPMNGSASVEQIAVNCASESPNVNNGESTSASNTWPDLGQVNSMPVSSALVGCQSGASNTNECTVHDTRGDEDIVPDFQGSLQTWAIESQSSHAAVTSHETVMKCSIVLHGTASGSFCMY